MSGTILAIAEQSDGKLRKSAYETATAAARLARETGAQAVALVFGGGAAASELGSYGIDHVLGCGGPRFERYAPGAFAQAIVEACRTRDAKAVLFPATAAGKDLAPRAAALLDVPLASDCVGLAVENGRIVARRPVYAGKAFWTVATTAKHFLATLRPNVFTPAAIRDAAAPVEEFAPAQGHEPRVFLKERIDPQGGRRVELTEADVIVSGGRGMKGPENYHVLEALADALGGAVGASRAAVDAGWRPHADQVGQTGKTVSPNLYIACGISGAIQHLAGMSSSRVIVAINQDREAPIFKIADYGIVGDLFEVVPALTAEVERAKG